LSAKKIGIYTHSTLIDGKLNELDRELDIYQKLGFKYTEVGVHGVDAIAGTELNLDNIEKVKHSLDKYKFKTTVHAPDILNLRDEENFELHKKVFESSIDFTEKLGAHILVYHLGIIRNNFKINSEEKTKEKEINTLKKLAEFSKKKGVQICIENNTDKDSPRELVELVEKVNKKNVGICCDFGHAFLSFKGDEFKLLEFIERTLPYLKHIHAHDNFGIPKPDIGEKLDYRFLLPYGIGDLHMPPGMGKIPYQKIKPLLSDYSGIILMEVRYRYLESYSSILNMEF